MHARQRKPIHTKLNQNNKHMKKSIKENKPAFIVDATKIKSLSDIDVAFGLAKQDAGLPISNEELAAICKDVCDHFATMITIVDCSNCECKKKPWYKRFWNWLTGKKN